MSADDDATQLQITKTRLEIEKLATENRLLGKKWRQAPYLGAILPLLAACLTIGATGWIAYSNSDFKRDAETAKSEIAKLKPERDRLAAEVRTLQRKTTALQNQNTAFESRISTWRTQTVDINSRLKSAGRGPLPGYILPGVNSVELERKKLQEITDSMLSTLNSK
jgi:FtsZ-binding cell division protein ZapB